MARGEAAAGLGGARLHEHRPPLRPARQVERTRDLVMSADVIDRHDPFWPRILARRAIIDDGVVRPAVPQRRHHLHELLAAGVAVGVADLGVAAIVACRRGEPRGDDVPADPPVADVVERGELAREIVRLSVGGRGGGDQADPLGRGRQRAERGDRLQPRAAGMGNVVAQRQLVGDEDRVEQPGLGPARDVLVVADVRQRQRRGQGVAPRGLVMTWVAR